MLGSAWLGTARQGLALHGHYKSQIGEEITVDMIKVGELVIDYGILPRAAVNFAHVGTLKNAALAGGGAKLALVAWTPRVCPALCVA